jgi:hypothetical protein
VFVRMRARVEDSGARVGGQGVWASRRAARLHVGMHLPNARFSGLELRRVDEPSGR